MIDVHCHILSGIDDGADDFAVSLSMADIAAETGTTAIIATPHCNVPYMPYVNSGKFVSECVEKLNSALADEGVPLTVYPGCEIFAAGNFVELLKSGKLITLNNSVYPLVEFDFFEPLASVLVKLQQLLAEGFVPIVAHPERYAFVEDDDTAIKKLKDIGCLIQVNKGSLAGRFGAPAKFNAHEMLVKGQVDVIASDAHGIDVRTPILIEAYDMVSGLYGADYARLLFEINPKKILSNKEI